MKKICFITTIPGTIESFILKTAIYLHENTDWDISFICDEDEEFAKSLPEYIHYFPVKMKRGINLSSFKAIGQMKKIFRQEKFDMIQYSTPNASLYASIAGKKAKVPVRLYCQWGIVYVGFKGIKRKIFKTIEKFVCKNSTWIEPDSHSNLDFSHLERLYPATKGSVIWNGSACGVDLTKFDIAKKEEYRKEIRDQYNLPENAFVYGFVGRITGDKGINELLLAFKRLIEKRQNTYLMLVGSLDKTETIDSSLLEWSQNCERVLYTGRTNRVEAYLSATDIYILPSYREGFGLGVVEAQAMGVPVIVTNIPGPIDGMKEGGTGLVVPVKDAAALQEGMEEMLNNSSLRMECAKNAPIYAQEGFEQKRLQQYILEDRKRLFDEAENKR